MSEKPIFGQIDKIELRKVWKHEANDFTPWLAENISKLGEVLGLELELLSREAPVGDFSLDLLARDTSTGTNRTVIIENQLNQTDHEHLGKLLTYSGGSDARVIIWVADGFRDEHRQAIDWLNQRTDETTLFFGIVVEIWQIDDSKLAPHFNIIASPNEWSRETGRNVREANATEKNLQYRAFFQHLIEGLKERGFKTNRTGLLQNWCDFALGYGQRVRLSAVFAQGNRAVICVYIDNGDKKWNKELFDQIMEKKESIESEISESLEWERLDHRTASRIAISRHGGVDDTSDRLKEIEEWMIDKLLVFHKVFNPILNELITDIRPSSSEQ